MTAAGDRRELDRYQLPEGTRAVVAQRIDGRVAISDVPVDHADRVYLIELQHAGGLAPGERPQPAVACGPGRHR
jgi:hypothetical protein